MAYTFITGATGGIGKAFAVACAKKGYNLFLTGRSDEKLNSLKEEINAKYSVDVLTIKCDLTSETERLNMVDFARSKGVKFDRIILVAGVDTQKAFTEYTREKMLFQLRVNAESNTDLAYLLIQLKDTLCELICISSMSGQSPMPYFALYSASKNYLTNLFTSLHFELKQQGVKVTSVLPGGVYTRDDIVEEIKSQGLWGKLSAKSPEFVAEKSLKAVKKNKTVYIPGFFNKFLNFTMKLLPKPIVLRFIARRWKKHSKDAF
jgi:short-subunit dehydrogenase